MKADQLIKRRSKRMIAKVMAVIESELDPAIADSPDARRARDRVRKALLDEVNDFADLACDVAMSGEASTFWFNEDFWGERLDGAVRRAVREEMRSDATDPLSSSE